MIIALTPCKSSNLKATGYDEASATLAVQFANGTTWHYSGVPVAENAAMLAAPSIGSYFAKSIRPKYDGKQA